MATEKDLRAFGRLICDVVHGMRMDRATAREAYRQVILNEQPELQQGAFLMAHIARGPSTEELAGAWEALDQYDTAKISVEGGGPVCDIVGTGSDALKTVNCSTPAAFIAAGCGLMVAKKGARLVTGVSGASDILEIMGIDLDAPLSTAEECLRAHGICYLPGETFLKSGWARLIRSMRFTSAFNIIGPLTRPCAATNTIIIGGYSPAVCGQLIAILREIGMDRALSPYGMAEGVDSLKGMDEFSPCGVTRVTELRHGHIDTYDVTPRDFGVRQVHLEAIASQHTAAANADAIRRVLDGEFESPLADFFCMNAAAALYASGKALGYAQGMTLARQALASGKAYEKYLALRDAQGAR